MPAAVRGRVVTADRVVDDGAVAYEGSTIIWVGPVAEAPVEVRGLLDGLPITAGYVLPGLVDLHCHGGAGIDFTAATDAAEVRTAVGEHLSHGTTSLVASLVTAPPEVLRERVAQLADLAQAGEIAGIHLEGPFLAVGRRGAQAPEAIRAPDRALTAELLDLGRGHVVTMTLAPELPGATADGGVLDALVAGGGLPSFGHTDADADQARDAVERAYRRLSADPAARSRRPTVTHLGNAMAPVQHRNPGPILEFLAAAANGRLVLELIGDGVHLAPDFVRAVVDLVGRENVVLVTDAMAAAGMADGTYPLGTQHVVVADGVARLTGSGRPTGSTHPTDAGHLTDVAPLTGAAPLAGGTAHLIDVVRTTVAGGVALVDAVHAAATGPAEVLGDGTIGVLAAGRRADLVLTDENLHPHRVVRKGVTQ